MYGQGSDAFLNLWFYVMAYSFFLSMPLYRNPSDKYSSNSSYSFGYLHLGPSDEMAQFLLINWTKV